MRKYLAVALFFYGVCAWAQQPQMQVNVPLHTVHSGEAVVSLALRYTPGGGWVFKAEGDKEDAAGNRVVFTDNAIVWPQGHINLDADKMQVFDVHGNLIKSVRYERRADGRLSRVQVGEEATTFSYPAGGIDLGHQEGAVTAYRFDSLDRVVSVKHITPRGSLLIRELQYQGDTLTVTARDNSGLLERSLFLGAPQVKRIEEYDAGGKLTRTVTFHYQGDLRAGETVQLYGAGELGTLTASRRLRYAPGSAFPCEETFVGSDGKARRATFTYASHRPDALLSLTRWDGGQKVDSTRLVYSAFPGQGGRSVLYPSAVLYAKSGEPLDTVIRFVPYDFNGVHTYRSKRVKQFYSDPRITRQVVTSPSEDLKRELQAHLYSIGMPYRADALEGEGFLFDEGGAFLSRIDGSNEQVEFCRGFGREPVRAAFADPVQDPTLIDTRSCVQTISRADVELSMQIVDAYGSWHHGLVRGCVYLLKESGYGGLIDPAVNAEHQVFPGVWYISETPKEGSLAHNNFNCGNFLWGAAAHATGVPLWVTLVGTHFNNFFLSPDNKGHLDDKDDVLSIRAGYHMLDKK